MKSGVTEQAGKIQLTAEVPLPSLIRSLLKDHAGKLLQRHMHRFKSAMLHMHLKRSGPQIGCNVNLFTDDGKYHSYVEGWDVRQSIDEALDTINNQVKKYFDKRTIRI